MKIEGNITGKRNDNVAEEDEEERIIMNIHKATSARLRYQRRAGNIILSFMYKYHPVLPYVRSFLQWKNHLSFALSILPIHAWLLFKRSWKKKEKE